MTDNLCTLDIHIISEPVVKKDGRVKVIGENFRTSGVADIFELRFPVGTEVHNGDYLYIEGFCCSLMSDYKTKIDRAFIIVESFEHLDSAPKLYTNNVKLVDAVFKHTKEYRESRDGSGKMVMTYVVQCESGFVHCLSWSHTASDLYKMVKVGDRVTVCGRLQSYKRNGSNKLSFSLVTNQAVSIYPKSEDSETVD